MLGVRKSSASWGDPSLCLVDSDKDFVVSLWPWRTRMRQEFGSDLEVHLSFSTSYPSPFKIFIFKLCVCICMWVYMHMNAGTPGGQKRELDHLELEL